MLLDQRNSGTRQDDVGFGLVPAETGGFAFLDGWATLPKPKNSSGHC
jgi:hypothetical protein